jgi:hypothetical protein
VVLDPLGFKPAFTHARCGRADLVLRFKVDTLRFERTVIYAGVDIEFGKPRVDVIGPPFAPLFDKIGLVPVALLRRDLNNSRKALYRSTAARHRAEASKARTDMREWAVKRRERTRQLIELGGLVAKAGLVDLTDDDRATLYGAFFDIAGRLQGAERDNALALWKRRGKRAFDAEEEAQEPSGGVVRHAQASRPYDA